MEILNQNKQWFLSEVKESIHHLCHTYFPDVDENGNAEIEEFSDGIYTEIDPLDLRIAMEYAVSSWNEIMENCENIRNILETTYQDSFCKELAWQYCINTYEFDSFNCEILQEYTPFRLSDSDFDAMILASSYCYKHIFAANDLNGETKIFIQ